MQSLSRGDCSPVDTARGRLLSASASSPSRLQCLFPCRPLSALQPRSLFPCIQRGHHTGPCFCPACCLETFCWITKLCYQVLTERLPWLVEIRGSHACFAHWIVRSESATLPKHLCMPRTQASTLYWGCSTAFSFEMNGNSPVCVIDGSRGQCSRRAAWDTGNTLLSGAWLIPWYMVGVQK